MSNRKNLFFSIVASAAALTGLGLPSAATVQTASASPVGGPAQTVDVIDGYSRETYTVRCWADEMTWITVDGDGSSDLDLYLYDENGNLIDSDLGYSDYGVVSVNPRWTGTFYIEVINRGGRANLFVLTAE